MRQYLITGGLGLVGSCLANTLSGKVRIISRSDRNKDRIKKKGIDIRIKQLRDIDAADVKDIDVIYHCASTVDNYNILSDPYVDVDTNLNGTIRLLEVCKALRKKPKIIYPSTFFVYGNEYDKTGVPINEESATDPLALYPATKLCAESVIKLYSKLFGIPYLIFRLTNVYGAGGEYNNKKHGALNYLIMRAVLGEDIPVYQGGGFYRDYIYVDDVVSAFLHLEQKVKNDLFLLGYGRSVLFKDIIDAIVVTAKSKSKIKKVEPTDFHKVVGINNFVADTSKIVSHGWKAKVDYRQGVKLIVDRYKKLG